MAGRGGGQRSEGAGGDKWRWVGGGWIGSSESGGQTSHAITGFPPSVNDLTVKVKF